MTPTYGDIRRSLPCWAVVLTVLTVLAGTASAVADQGFGTRLAGRHVYDRAAVLSAADVTSLEAHARAVERAGAPVVIYLRARAADVAQTQQDAQDLMATWNLQSGPNAHDDLVVFLNLTPGNLRHGQVAL